jgi:hypothetical protein
MTRYLLLLLALCSVSFGQSLEGFWTGTMQIEGKTLRAWIEFTKAADGTLSAVAESPDESNEKIPVTTIRQNGREVMISIASLSGVWEGKFTDNGTELEGKWTQNGAAYPLNFKKSKREKKE